MIVNSPSLDPVDPVLDFNADSPVIGWHTVLTPTSVVVSPAADPLHPVSNLANPSTTAGWRGQTGAEHFVTGVGLGQTLDYMAVARHNFGSEGMQIRLQVQNTVGGAFNTVIASFTPPDDEPLIMRFEPQVVVTARLRILPATTSDIPRASVMYLGRLLILQRRIYVGHTPLTMGRNARITNGRAESGDFLGRIVLTETLQSAISMQNLSPDWYRDNMDPFIAASKDTPFFVAWRPGDYPEETSYAWMTNEPQPSNQRPNGMMQVDFQYSGLKI